MLKRKKSNWLVKSLSVFVFMLVLYEIAKFFMNSVSKEEKRKGKVNGTKIDKKEPFVV